MCSPGLKAQSYDEWFRQKKTQKKYLVQQLAALKVYAAYLQEGYLVAKQGLGLIEGFKSGEFGLHTEYFNSLKNVNPAIKQHARVKEIIESRLKIRKVIDEMNKQLKESKAFDREERLYLIKVFQRIERDSKQLEDELILVIENGKLEMKDDERISKIDKLHDQMQQACSFVQRFSNEVLQLERARAQEQREIVNRKLLLSETSK
ncbi:hypothetical protein D3C72_1686800 [compost metagenome]